MTSTEEFKIEIGLTALVYNQQPCTPFRCDWHVYDLDGTNWPNEYVEVNLQSCRDEAYGEDENVHVPDDDAEPGMGPVAA